jgi:hypothetical protein
MTDSGASPLQIISLIFILCSICFAFGWMMRDMKGNKIRRFNVRHSVLHKLRVQRRLINLATLSKRYDWKDNIY